MVVIQSIKDMPSLLSKPDDTSVAKDSRLVGNRRLRHVQLRTQFVNANLFINDRRNNPNPGRVGQRRKQLGKSHRGCRSEPRLRAFLGIFPFSVSFHSSIYEYMSIFLYFKRFRNALRVPRTSPSRGWSGPTLKLYVVLPTNPDNSLKRAVRSSVASRSIRLHIVFTTAFYYENIPSAWVLLFYSSSTPSCGFIGSTKKTNNIRPFQHTNSNHPCCVYQHY